VEKKLKNKRWQSDKVLHEFQSEEVDFMTCSGKLTARREC